jgi:hypothetical protein
MKLFSILIFSFAVGQINVAYACDGSSDSVRIFISNQRARDFKVIAYGSDDNVVDTSSRLGQSVRGTLNDVIGAFAIPVNPQVDQNPSCTR